ncbi:conjugal transfer protein TraD [Chryseobacterium caseinilyticum]|uniref:Conjugal transfer protein TraD n=1 Tax=Chryseobacterium caseinilyticum TaxID=2771428 RepID=A0ABR8ZGZ8_9FLAO|nr:conjugal transfer protein TraD [Chryseobacterium caseinilyticum]MBD8084572.1 conjugal transfer protein TraD [Chryseobacterium caseinilyticum]
METVIIICLLIVIFLLMQDKAANKKIFDPSSPCEDKKNKHPSVMGEPKRLILNRHQSDSSEPEKKYSETASERLNVEDSKEERYFQIPNEDLDKVFSGPVDLEEEEEEWKKYGFTVDSANLAQGVTFEEFDDAGRLLRSDPLRPIEKDAAVHLFSKIQGTELFNLLESSINGVSVKIATLLDNSFSKGDIKKDVTEFDINEFI